MNLRIFWISALLASLLAGCSTPRQPSVEVASAQAQPVQAVAPVQTVAGRPVLRVRPGATPAQLAIVNELLTRMLDDVWLYTLIGDLKPMSDGYADSTSRNLSEPEFQRRVELYKSALDILESDLIECHIIVRRHSTPRYLGLWAFRTDLVRRKIQAHPDVFTRENISPDTSVRVIAQRLGNLAFRDLHRVQGLLYGFPAEAVDFFLRAMPTARAHQGRGPIGDRKPVNIPTYRGGLGGFVYVIPIERDLSAEDLAIKSKAEAILAEYKARRPRYAKDGRVDAIALINDWYAGK